MNYYEQLGLTPGASSEEIKDAYRALMRLLHPDFHSDPQLREVAEQQVKKWNAIYAILSDPERRRQYDRAQAEARERAVPIIVHAPPPPARGSFVNRSSAAWIAAVAAFALLLVWMASRPTPAGPSYNHEAGASIVDPGSKPVPSAEPLPQTPGEHEAELQAIANSAKQVDAKQTEAKQASEDANALRLHLVQAMNERDSALAEVSRLQARLSSERMERAALASKERPSRQKEREVAEVKSEPKPEMRADARLGGEGSRIGAAPPPVIAPTVAPVPVLVARSPIAGSWFYQKPTVAPKNKDLYPPEFIETVITEDHGQVKGTYHARYHVPNRPVSPDVSFQFAGKVNGDSGSLQWNGSGGSRGEVTLKLTTDHGLKVDWTASQLGTLGFYRGTAVLVRKAD